MKIIKKGKMQNGDDIQVEEWNENYDFEPYGSTVAIYLKSKYTYNGPFSPRKGQLMRASFQFDSSESAEKAFESLISGNKTPSDYMEFFEYRHKYPKTIL